MDKASLLIICLGGIVFDVGWLIVDLSRLLSWVLIVVGFVVFLYGLNRLK